ncbi:MAG: C40 family peptidase [Pseudonocardia sp.]|uniref:NlpC/P60 family protein n=1 Tax=unclassified Pseudonocardia TaxID=2619320 RepID=UPI000ABBCA14|nr:MULTISPECIES: NlpC/P60 family protein [unclassified Pseudonocardia]MBN9112535.1 C40 family peptidase [Pseudonocardia sp.]
MRVGRAVLVVVLSAALAFTAGTPAAFAQPSPPPPPNPSNQDLQNSRDAVNSRSAQVAQLTGRLTDLQAQADDLQIQVAEQHESANAAQDTYDSAQSAAEAAAQRAQRARSETEAAGAAIDAARTRLDDFVASTYQGGLDLGPLGLLTSSSGPEDFVDRAQLTEAITRQQTSALDALQRARAEKANADSTARAAQEEADRQAQAAAAAKAAADAALVQAQQAAAAQAQRLQDVTAQQEDVQRQLDAAENADAGLRAQRQRFDTWQRQQAEAEAARQRAEQQAAASRAGTAPPPTAPRTGGSVQVVIDRAMSQLGVIYAWGGGTARGPSLGIRDGGVADANGDYKKIGFDCSGLMLYAFAGVGIQLPRYSGNQHAAGRQVPLSQMRPGDMLAWARNGRVYHIALYIGNGKMVEAPYSGARVRVSPVRYAGLLPTVARML